MNLKLLLCGLSLSVFLIQNASAQFDIDPDDPFDLRKEDAQKMTDPKNAPITAMVKDMIPAPALENIIHAEQAFCYTVEAPSDDYKGYTLDNMKLTGFCGMLPQEEIDLFIDVYLKNSGSVSAVVDKCVINPRIMLRFVRGVDFADVLYSSPCHSFTVFYGGQFQSVNTSPSADILDQIITAYEKNKMPFVSPAMFKQILPIGIPQTEEQKSMLRRQNATQPVRNWKTQNNTQEQAPVQNNNQPASAPKAKGWNQIKMNRAQ